MSFSEGATLVSPRTIAFIGLGHMGAPMAGNLVSAGHTVLGYDLVPQLCDAAATHGVEIVESANEAAARASVVLTMLPAGKHVLQVYGDPLSSDPQHVGLLAAASPNTLFIDCSTISVEDSRQASAAVVAAGHRALDAPVSGGVVGAENATLAFMVGGEDNDFAEAEPLLSVMGKRIVHCGASGLGQAAKICNNMILGVSQIVVAEAFVLGEQLGLSHEALYEVASNASGQCWALTTNCPVPGPVPTSPANRDYQPGFAGSLMAKDLGLAKHAIEATGVQAAFGLHAEEMYAAYAEGEGATTDFSGIITEIRAATEL